MPVIPIHACGETCVAFDHDPETGKPVWGCQRCNVSGADGPLKISGWVEVQPFPRGIDRRRLAELEEA